MLSPSGMYIGGNAYLDENLFNTWDGPFGTPRVLQGNTFVESEVPVEAGPGTIIPLGNIDGEFERGYNAYYGAPGYYIDYEEVQRVVDLHDDAPWPTYAPAIGENPWDYMNGTIGSYGVFAGTEGVGVRDWGSQEGAYSLS